MTIANVLDYCTLVGRQDAPAAPGRQNALAPGETRPAPSLTAARSPIRRLLLRQSRNRGTIRAVRGVYANCKTALRHARHECPPTANQQPPPSALAPDKSLGSPTLHARSPAPRDLEALVSGHKGWAGWDLHAKRGVQGVRLRVPSAPAPDSWLLLSNLPPCARISCVLHHSRNIEYVLRDFPRSCSPA